MAMLLVWAATLLVFRPPALDADALHSSMTRKLSTWTGGELTISGPVRISYFPAIAVEANGVRISAPGRIPNVSEISVEKLRIETGFMSLLWPNTDFEKLILEGAKVMLRKAGPAPEIATPQKDEFRLLQALKDTPVERLLVRGSEIVLPAAETREKIELIESDIRLTRGSGALSGSGKFQWRKQPVTFSISGAAPQIDNGSAAIPVQLKVETPALAATFDGRAAITSGIQLAGNIDVNISDLVNFAHWMGLLLPEDSKKRAFTAAGKFDWENGLIGFDEGSFSIDGNRAIGAMSVKLGDARPQIEGTLAFQKLTLSGLLPGTANEPKSVPGTPDGFAWMHHFDVDLRISTVSLMLPSLEIGQAAISTVLTAGQLDADFAVLDLCGGRANGRFEYNAAVAEGRARLVTNVDGLSAKTCLTALTGSSPLRGLTAIDGDVTAEGRNLPSLLQKLTGTLTLTLTDGEMDLDIAKLDTLAMKGGLRGWSTLLGRTTPVSTLDGKIVLRPGTAYSNSLTLVTGDKSALTGEGTVNLASGDLDYHIELGALPAPEAATPALATEKKPPSRVRVSGSWKEPVFQPEPVRSGMGAHSPEHHAANFD